MRNSKICIDNNNKIISLMGMTILFSHLRFIIITKMVLNEYTFVCGILMGTWVCRAFVCIAYFLDG